MILCLLNLIIKLGLFLCVLNIIFVVIFPTLYKNTHCNGLGNEKPTESLGSTGQALKRGLRLGVGNNRRKEERSGCLV